MSQLLREFLIAYRDWVDAGAVEGKPFSRGYGLCTNFGRSLHGSSDDYEAIELEEAGLRNVFIADGLDQYYPFCDEEDYFEEIDRNMAHLNESRIQWVHSKVAQFEVV